MTDPSTEDREPDRSVGRSGDADPQPGGGPGLDESSSWTALPMSESPPEEPAQNMIPARVRRRTKLERGSMRVLATGGIVGLSTVLGAVLVSQDVAGWIVGLVAGLTSVILAAVLWSSRQL